MCQVIEYEGREIETVGQLVGICDVVHFLEPTRIVVFNGCLCPVDVESTAVVNGIWYERLTGVPEWRWRKSAIPGGAGNCPESKSEQG